MSDNNNINIDDSLKFLDQINIYENASLDDLFKKGQTFDTEDLFEDDEVETEEVETEAEVENVAESTDSDSLGDTEEIVAHDILETEPQDQQEQPEDNVDKEKPKKEKRFVNNLIFVMVCMVIAFALAFLLSKFVIHNTIVDGDSMCETLNDGDRLLVDKLAYNIGDPARYDIIVFEQSDDENYIKRVIGLPGEVVQIYNGAVYINGMKLDGDTYGNTQIKDPGIAEEPVILGDDEYFVLGDNRNNSIDSRKKSVGKVKRDKIDGRAIFRIYPFSKIGSVKK